MANLTSKELTALSDQLDFERVLHCKYLRAGEPGPGADQQVSVLRQPAPE